MKLSQLRIQNFRSFEDETIDFGDYSCFVGPNGSGKSTVLNALNILFRNTQAASNVVTLVEEDFHLKKVEQPITITATFTDLSEKAKEDLKAYVRQNKLILSARAEWNKETQTAEVQQFGSREIIKDFAKYFRAEKEGTKVSDLKNIFQEIREKYSDIDAATTKDAMQQALRKYEEEHPKLCEPVESNDQFYGWSKGANLLEQHCQWVYIPAVKDPTEEQQEGKNTALGTLLQRTIRSQIDFKDPLEELRREMGQKYQELLKDQQDILLDIGKTIQERLRAWSHPGARVELLWHYDDSKSVSVADPMARAKIGEGAFLGEMVRVGHGMQRSFIVALLQVLSSTHEGEQPTLILGFEEPELYQHPPQARHLSSLLDELSKGDAQIIVTTHSPYFISAKGFEGVRMTRSAGPDGKTIVTHLTYQTLSSSLSKALGGDPSSPTSIMAAVEQIMQPSQNELFFSQIPVLVEGPEDIAFITTHLHLSGKWSEFRRCGCHFVVCGGKTNLSRPLAIAKGLGIPAYVIFDGDCDKATGEEKFRHKTDNQCILNLCNLQTNPLPDSTYFSESLVMWCTRIQDEIVAEIGQEKWDNAELKARQEHSLSDGVRRKNPLVISATLENMWNEGIKSSLLEKLCVGILNHARKVTMT
ncbi:MAG: AAA family ATPase [Thermodesulfobacteriota bacterium]|jgi:predicted ATP-dependent endonuclease of OLD family|nr:MAG: AAA family ATPase [Thermodesulfobacteriota bacterium]